MNKIDVSLEKLRLSVSKAKSFSDCKKKFKYSYIEKLPSKEYDHLTFGSFVHKILEDFHNYFITNNDPRAEKYNKSTVMNLACKNALNEFKGKVSKEMKLEVWDLMNKYLLSYNSYKYPNVLNCEKDFKITFENNIELKGFIDRIDMLDDGTIKVSDYKTSKSDKYLINDPFQLLTYSYVLLRENPDIPKIVGSYIMIRDNFSEIEFEFTKEQILSVEEKFQNYSVEIRNEKDYLPTPTILCNWCSYVDICSEGKKMLFNKNLISGEVDW